MVQLLMWLVVVPWIIICTVLILFVVPWPFCLIVCVAEVVGGFAIGRYLSDG